MQQKEISHMISQQRLFFASGKTLAIDYRIQALKRLQAIIQKYETEISTALQNDLGKSKQESYMCEIGLTLSEISYMIKHVKKFARKKKVRTPLSQFAAKSYVQFSPYGVCLIMSPWNYPFLLTLEPLVDALAAGNTVIVKPSAYSAQTSAILEKIITECFAPEYVAILTGGREANQNLLQEQFDYIFFTGSQTVGHEVMKYAAAYLTPITLELGGKSPCLVDDSAKISLAAKRIVFGKFLNCGQTCVAPDYIYCDEKIKDHLIQEIIQQIEKQFGQEPLQNENYGKIINAKHFGRLTGLLDASKIIYGGKTHQETLRIEPTIMTNIHWEDAVMQEEIFGPILPILTFQQIEEAINTINDHPHPLAFYCFSENRQTVEKITQKCQFGGGCINDTIIHLATSYMGFGGVGASGMGAYHGQVGFTTFSHQKGMVDKKTWLDLPMRYQPYQKKNEKLVRFFLK